MAAKILRRAAGKAANECFIGAADKTFVGLNRRIKVAMSRDSARVSSLITSGGLRTCVLISAFRQSPIECPITGVKSIDRKIGTWPIREIDCLYEQSLGQTAPQLNPSKRMSSRHICVRKRQIVGFWNMNIQEARPQAVF